MACWLAAAAATTAWHRCCQDHQPLLQRPLPPSAVSLALETQRAAQTGCPSQSQKVNGLQAHARATKSIQVLSVSRQCQLRYGAHTRPLGVAAQCLEHPGQRHDRTWPRPCCLHTVLTLDIRHGTCVPPAGHGRGEHCNAWGPALKVFACPAARGEGGSIVPVKMKLPLSCWCGVPHTPDVSGRHCNGRQCAGSRA
jgi:hypothetical protein